MKFYLAPMEGLTGYIFRNAYHKYFSPMDKYFTPFIASKGLNHKELNDILPEHNREIVTSSLVVPQILTNRAEEFLTIAKRLQEFGYESVNLNLGCPSGTVTAKKRGAGFLAFPEELDRFLEEIFSKCPLKISVKTRIGVQDAQEWGRLEEIYAKYPLEELIIHPRLQKDLYRGCPDRNTFAHAAGVSRCPVCYNGDLYTVEDYQLFQKQFPDVPAVMLGRGILKNPGLTGELRGGKKACTELLKAFHDELLCGYQSVMSGDANVLFKMKEFWTYFGQGFPDSGRDMKKIKKAGSISEYRIAVNNLFR